MVVKMRCVVSLLEKNICKIKSMFLFINFSRNFLIRISIPKMKRIKKLFTACNKENARRRSWGIFFIFKNVSFFWQENYT